MFFSSSVSFQVEQKLLDTTARESNGWNLQRPYLRGWSVDLEGAMAFNEDDGTPLIGQSLSDTINDLYINRDMVYIKVTFAGSPAGSKAWVGEAYITSIGIEAPMEANTTYSFSLKGVNDLFQGINGQNL